MVRGCCYQQVFPRPNTPRFVRLVFLDADPRKSVRPAHRGSHHARAAAESGEEYGEYVPVATNC